MGGWIYWIIRGMCGWIYWIITGMGGWDILDNKRYGRMDILDNKRSTQGDFNLKLHILFKKPRTLNTLKTIKI